MRPTTLACSFLLIGGLYAQEAAAPPAAAPAEKPAVVSFRHDAVDTLAWRNLGPTNMSGRLTDVEVQGHTWYVATAAGGVFKSGNCGTTWTSLFEREAVASIGDIAVAPSNPDVVWLGTGEENARNSVSWGDGVYKSTDGGKTWKHRGLRDTFQIGHIAIHPDNADVVYVAALGRLWGDNRERGLFRTRDGGETWEKVLYADEKTGCIDVRLHAKDPNIVLAVMYERRRGVHCDNDPAVRFGEKAGLYRSTDGGETWTRVTAGLPSCKWGRAALALYRANPDVVYMQVETERSGWATGTEKAREGAAPAGDAYLGISSEDSEEGARLVMVSGESPAEQGGLRSGDVVTKIGDKAVKNNDDLVGFIRAAKAGEKIAVEVSRGGEPATLHVTLGKREASAQDPLLGAGSGPNGGRLGGQVANVQESQGDQGFETGGLFRSADAGLTWQRVNSLNERPFYFSQVAVHPQDEQKIFCCGISLWGTTNGGKSFRAVHGNTIHVDFHHVWIDPEDGDHMLVACDGGLNVTRDGGRTWEVVRNLPIGQFYHVAADNDVPYNVYGGLQDNGSWGGPSRSRWREGVGWYDWFRTGSGDGFGAAVDWEDSNTIYYTSQNGGLGRFDRKSGRSASVQKPRRQGVTFRWNWDTPFFVSPHNAKILYFAGNYACRSVNRGSVSEPLGDKPLGLTETGTATAFAESPRQAGLLYVGTDDGALWRSDDGGHAWEPLHDKVVGLPAPRYVSCLHPSTHKTDRVYATFDGHRFDDFATYAFVSEDRGRTWRALTANLPAEPCFSLREDPVNEELLFLGTEFSCWVSLDRGREWFRLGKGLPTVPVRDLAIQNRDADLCAATHGRGIWVCDIAPLRQLTAEVAGKDVWLFEPESAILWRMDSRGVQGDKEWFAANPPYGVTLYLWHKEAPQGEPEVTIHDVAGRKVASLKGEARAGIQAVQWQAQEGGGRMRRPTAPGSYSARLQVGEQTQIRGFTLRPDPLTTEGAASERITSGN
jgi:photosystem II stability/assembly factor-like uncharacterized protein